MSSKGKTNVTFFRNSHLHGLVEAMRHAPMLGGIEHAWRKAKHLQGFAGDAPVDLPPIRRG